MDLNNDLNHNNDEAKEKNEEKKIEQNDENPNSPKFDAQDKLRSILPNYNQQYNLWDYRVGFGRRFAAAIIDSIFVAILISILGFATGVFSTNMNFSDFIDPNFATNFMKDYLPITLLVSFVYYSTEILLSGSPGKHVLGIIIAEENMHYANYYQLTTRFLIKHLDLVFSLIYYFTWSSIFSTLSSYVSFLVMIFFFFVIRQNKQSIYDKITKTAVFFKKEVDINIEKESQPNI